MKSLLCTFGVVFLLFFRLSGAPTLIPIANSDFEGLSGSDPQHFSSNGKLLPAHFTQPLASPFCFNGVNLADPGLG